MKRSPPPQTVQDTGRTPFDEILQRGYSGRLTTVKDFVRDLKAAAVREVIARFETDPGVQAQVGWGECGTVVEGGERRKLYVFVRGYSRMLVARFTRRFWRATP